MNRKKELNRLARFIHYILGLHPDEFGLLTDDKGFVKIKDLLKVLHEEPDWRHIGKSHINEMMMTLTNPPVQTKDAMIRDINQDHPPPKTPAKDQDLPKLLYTAIRSRAWPHVASNGLKPLGGLSHVLLCKEKSLCDKIGKRTDQNPVLLTINCSKAQKENVRFYFFGKHLVLSAFLPPTCISGPPFPKEKHQQKTTKPVPDNKRKERSKTPGSYFPDLGADQHQDRRRSKNKNQKTVDWKRQRKKDKRKNQQKWPGE